MKKKSLTKNEFLLLLFCIAAVTAGIAIQYSNWLLFGLSCTVLGGITSYKAYSSLIIIPKMSSLLTHVRKLRRTNEKIKTQDEEDIFQKLNSEINAWDDEQALEEERLTQLENYRKEYIGNVSHELKTPIFSIQGYLHTLIDGGSKDENISEKYLRRAADGVDRMIGIVQDLETISQLEAGELELNLERFDLMRIVKEVVESNEMAANLKHIGVTIKNNPADAVYVFADIQKIRQVLTNLISNSIRYGKENGETKIKLSDLDQSVIVEIADNGIGIPQQHLGRIFERFYRADKGRSREQGGTGLGLAIVKHIVEAHRQSIQVMSTEGAGSVFTFTLAK